MTKPSKQQKEHWENMTKIIARMVYDIQGSDKNQPKMTGLKYATGTFTEILQDERKKAQVEVLDDWGRAVFYTGIKDSFDKDVMGNHLKLAKERYGLEELKNDQ